LKWAFKVQHLLTKSSKYAKLLQDSRRCIHISLALRKADPVAVKIDRSQCHGPKEPPLLNITLGQAVDEAAERWPNREGLVVTHQNVRRTFSQLQQEVTDLAAGFLELGLKPGDRVGMWGPNTHEWYLTQFATAMAGLVLVNVNPAYQPRELKYALNKVSVSAIVASEHFKSQDYHSILRDVMPEIDVASPGNINSKEVPSLKHVIMISEKQQSGAHKFREIHSCAGSDSRRRLKETEATIKVHNPCNLQFTSGTTGNPKGVTLSHHNILNNAYHIGHRIGYNEKPHRICVSVPLYHCFGNVAGTLSSVLHGATCVLPCPSFNAKACVEAIEQEKCTSIYGTPTMFVDMLDVARQTKPDVSHVETGIMAGAPCPPELCKNVMSELNMADFVVCYGLTETSPVCFQGFCSDTMDRKVGTIGFASNHVEVAVVDDKGDVVEPGVKGELCTRGYSTMLGYWGDPEKTREAITEDGWFHTGDQAVIDSTGYGQIVGRIKDMIIRGGENIYPVEVEDFLYTHPAVMEAQVVGIPDPRMGEEVIAWVKLNPGHQITQQDLKKFCKGKLSHFKIPKFIFMVDSFPTTVTGKIQKFVMKEKTMEMIQEQQEAVAG